MSVSQERVLNVLYAPVVTEKASMTTGDKMQCVFKVATDATKIEVKQAVEQLLNVSVDSVRVCNMNGKTTRFRNVNGKRKSWKKAYVTLAAGQEIEVLDQA